MKNKITEANVSMVISKTFSGLNMNALKYLLPLWMTPLSGVTIRCTFAAVAFWIIGMFTKPETSTRKEKISLFLLGALYTPPRTFIRVDFPAPFSPASNQSGYSFLP